MGISRLLICGVLVALAAPFVRADDAPTAGKPPPLAEAAYREAAGEWNTLWRGRPGLSRRDEASCVSAWQTGDRVRTMVRGTTPPPAFVAYHEALIACIEASLATSDECLLKPNGGPKWMSYFTDARRKCPAVAGLVRRQRLRLPTTW